MKLNLIIGLASLCLLLCCKQKKDAEQPAVKIKGLDYQVQQKGSGEEVKPGNWLKVQVLQLYNDSILRDTRKTAAEYMKYDTSYMSKESLAVFKGAREGDSLEFKLTADSAFKQKRPAFAVKDGFLITRLKVEKILRSDEEYQTDKAASDSSFQKQPGE